MSFGFRYKFSKAWHAVWQKYKLEVQLKIAGRLFLIFIAVWLISSILTILSQWIFVYEMKETLFNFKYIEYFWTVIIELVSGFENPGEDTVGRCRPSMRPVSGEIAASLERRHDHLVAFADAELVRLTRIVLDGFYTLAAQLSQLNPARNRRISPGYMGHRNRPLFGIS